VQQLEEQVAGLQRNLDRTVSLVAWGVTLL
jgi:hypothetical protein